MDHKITLVIGGCRSGKSGFALDEANGIGGPEKIFLATSVPRDPEMDRRVAKHQAERGKDWQTVEEPVDIHEVIETRSEKADVILVDCLTLWTSNLMVQEEDESKIFEYTEKLVKALKKSQCPVFLVANEVGTGIVPDNALARQFRDLAGFVNQRIAGAADRVVLTVAGIGVQIKPKE
ncbi:bifunctional adenosylcobinamide kinase/adenosylcobinamide-phosphate guanylyltransferase [Desulfospira joergensenii]|uniref:bifunctional adenosylcobinamide kinase/adenosylcobinamide-phosphate guanylyltransferase n=1 Tax=Desulfospira joergensenii TaxID=53329 RepID=UPI0003B7A08A|nr:bifunctional adenosylcobinamide kinase/adenosylcobinamide-phosphate guanylyltransferase [Desulfospira joergensenii]